MPRSGKIALWNSFTWLFGWTASCSRYGNWARGVNKTIYLCVGLITSGHKEVLGMWLGETVSSLFWMSVLTDLKSRGVEDILITVTDNLNSFTDTIRAVSPQSTTLICVVHQIRNSCRYVV